ncbi:MAG: hypothetical protein K9K67_09080 [Bacteriovoracaceae bacterium]|nr:hypothetical protein [Bacteriovoracaceae bacterium]
MKFYLLVLFFSSFNARAFDPTVFENEYCSKTIVSGNRPGFYSIRSPLVFKNSGTRSYLQKITYKGETFYKYTDVLGSIPLRANLSKVKDFVVYNDHIWVIDEFDLIEFNESGRELNRFRFTQSQNKSDRPVGMDLREDLILLAHGGLGLVSFDLKTQQFKFLHGVNTTQVDGRKSLAVSVTWQGERAYVALTGNMQYAFNGIVTYDLSKNEVINRAAYRQVRYGVVDPGARLYVKEGSIYLNNGGWIHRFSEQDILTAEFPKPQWLPIPHQHNNRNMFLRIRGDFVLESDTIFGCALVERKATLAQRKL